MDLIPNYLLTSTFPSSILNDSTHSINSLSFAGSDLPLNSKNSGGGGDGSDSTLENYYNENSSKDFDEMMTSATTIFPVGLTSAITSVNNFTTRSAKDIAADILRSHIPEDLLQMSSDSKNCVIVYIFLFLVGAPGNLSIFITVGREIWRRQLMRSRIKVLIWHLATADLFVCFVVIPIEVFWRITVQWYGGDALCRISQFFRAFGLYLSSMVIICISLDRFFAIVFPLKVIGGMKRVRNMLWIAWISSILFASPQLLVFSVQGSPFYPTFKQCTNQQYFNSLGKEIVYNLLSLTAMYFAPLIIIIVTYAMVLYKIAMKTRDHQQSSRANGSSNLRRSDNASNITRARRRTLWLSMVIVTVFVICWTPYVCMTLWYMLDYETAEQMVDPRVREALFITAVSNSCVNPIIYGNYMKKYWRNLTQGACKSRSNSSSGGSHEMYRPSRRPVLYQYTSSNNSNSMNNNYSLSNHTNGGGGSTIIRVRDMPM